MCVCIIRYEPIQPDESIYCCLDAYDFGDATWYWIHNYRVYSWERLILLLSMVISCLEFCLGMEPHETSPFPACMSYWYCQSVGFVEAAVLLRYRECTLLSFLKDPLPSRFHLPLTGFLTLPPSIIFPEP